MKSGRFPRTVRIYLFFQSWEWIYFQMEKKWRYMNWGIFCMHVCLVFLSMIHGSSGSPRPRLFLFNLGLPMRIFCLPRTFDSRHYCGKKISKRDTIFFDYQYLHIEIKMNGKLLDDLFQYLLSTYYIPDSLLGQGIR